MTMDIFTIFFLTLVTVLNIVTLRMAYNERFLQAELIRRKKGESYPTFYTENKYYLPAVIAGILVIIWCLMWTYPYLPIKFMTPSFSDSNWIWATVASLLVCFPASMALGMVFTLIFVRPSGIFMQIISIVLSLVSAGLLVWMLFKVYNPWIIWFPILGEAGLIAPLIKTTTIEDIEIEEENRKEAERKAKFAMESERLMEKWRAERSQNANIRAAAARTRGFVPKRYTFHYNNTFYEVTQQYPTSDIHYKDQYGHDWEKMGDRWTKKG